MMPFCRIALVVLFCCFALLPAGASAAGKPVLTESVDEPGRTPYQEGVSASACNFAGDCDILFTTVPAGVRRVVEHVSCFVNTSAVTNVSFVTLFNEQFRNARNLVPLNSDGTGLTFFNDAATLAYYEA